MQLPEKQREQALNVLIITWKPEYAKNKTNKFHSVDGKKEKVEHRGLKYPKKYVETVKDRVLSAVVYPKHEKDPKKYTESYVNGAWYPNNNTITKIA